MWESIFNGLYSALYGNLAVAVLGAFAWGVASVLLSPCHLSGIPLMVAFMTGKRVLSGKETFRLSLVFALGILGSIAIIGVITALLGRMMGDLGSHANLVFGIALCLGGILLMDIIPLRTVPIFTKMHVDGTKLWTALMIGLLFGLALGPCAFAFMAPVLTLVFSMSQTSMILALTIIAAYAAGHCLVIVFAGASVSWVQKIMNWNDRSQSMVICKRVCALLVVMAGLYLIFK